MYRRFHMVDLIPEKGGSDKAFVELLARVSVFCIGEGGGGTCKTFCTGALVTGMERNL